MKKKLIIVGSICAFLLALVCIVTVSRNERKPEGVYYCEETYEEFTFYEDGTYYRENVYFNLFPDESSGRWELKEGILKLDGESSAYFSIFQYNSSTDSFSTVRKSYFWHKKIKLNKPIQ